MGSFKNAIVALLFPVCILAQAWEWTWVQGPSDAIDQAGDYGTILVAAPSNQPGARRRAANLVYNGLLFMYAGQGYDEAGLYDRNLNDMWSFDPDMDVEGRIIQYECVDNIFSSRRKKKSRND